MEADFKCPECEGTYFGATYENGSNIANVNCHTDGCRWSGKYDFDAVQAEIDANLEALSRKLGVSTDNIEEIWETVRDWAIR